MAHLSGYGKTTCWSPVLKMFFFFYLCPVLLLLTPLPPILLSLRLSLSLSHSMGLSVYLSESVCLFLFLSPLPLSVLFLSNRLHRLQYPAANSHNRMPSGLTVFNSPAVCTVMHCGMISHTCMQLHVFYRARNRLDSS